MSTLDRMWSFCGCGPGVRVEADVALGGGMDEQHGDALAFWRPSTRLCASKKRKTFVRG